MHVSALRASGYRNLDGTFELCDPLAVLVGENNTGKSNVIDALRTVLEPEAGPRARCWLREQDFEHDGHSNRLRDDLDLEVQLADLSADEQARLVTCLSSDDGSAARIRLRAKIATDGRVAVQWFGGESEHADVERHARDAVRFIYLPPLRDAAADLRPGRDNRLIALIAALAPPETADRDRIVEAAKEANAALDTIQAIRDARAHVADRLTGMTGRGRFAQQSNLEFDDPRFDRVVASLRAKIGEFSPLEMQENGLGFNNLLYMAVILAAISDAPADESPTHRVLLVEEPEAHLHPQLQDLLMRFLENQTDAGTQVVVTTHSPNFASSARVERLTVLARPGVGQRPIARLPRTFELDPKQLAHLRRFLDVTKAALFFARGVILVEGIAEQLLMPVMAARLGRPLAPNGVVVINVGGVAFPPFTDLFGPEKLPYRLAVITDSDNEPSAEELSGSAPSLSPRAMDLKQRSSENVRVCVAPHTLEYDLAEVGNVDVMLEALTAVKPKAGPSLRATLAAQDAAVAPALLLEKVADVKGRFAQELAELIAAPGTTFHVPAYICEAIEWVAEEIDEPDLMPGGAADEPDAPH
jgi:putative ATP-dependent endonuclease of the OLD family